MARWSKLLCSAVSVLALTQPLTAWNDCGACEVDFCDLAEDWCVSGRVDFVWAEPCEPLNWAVKETGNRDDLLAAEYDWSPGVRTALAFQFPSPGWYLYTEYFFLDAEGDSRTDAAGVTTFLGNGSPTSSSFRNELTLHELEILLAKDCCLCDSLSLTPYGGFRGMWLDRDFRESSSGGVFTTAGDGGSFDHSLHAYGLTAGTYFDYCLFEPIRFYGRLGGLVLVGSDDLRADSVQGGGAPDNTLVREVDCFPMFGMDTEVGIQYEYCLCGTTLHLGAGYFFSGYIGISNAVNRTMYTSSAVSGNILSIHGLSLQAGFDF